MTITRKNTKLSNMSDEEKLIHRRKQQLESKARIKAAKEQQMLSPSEIVATVEKVTPENDTLGVYDKETNTSIIKGIKYTHDINDTASGLPYRTRDMTYREMMDGLYAQERNWVTYSYVKDSTFIDENYNLNSVKSWSIAETAYNIWTVNTAVKRQALFNRVRKQTNLDIEIVNSVQIAMYSLFRLGWNPNRCRTYKNFLINYRENWLDTKEKL